MRYKYITLIDIYLWWFIYQVFGALVFLKLRICSPPPPPPQFFSHFNERCAMCWIEWKNNFQIFIFQVMVIFVLKTAPIFITRKIKIWKWFFHSIQHIAHLSLKWEKNWGEGLHILSWEKSQFSDTIFQYSASYVKYTMRVIRERFWLQFFVSLH